MSRVIFNFGELGVIRRSPIVVRSSENNFDMFKTHAGRGDVVHESAQAPRRPKNKKRRGFPPPCSCPTIRRDHFLHLECIIMKGLLPNKIPQVNNIVEEDR